MILETIQVDPKEFYTELYRFSGSTGHLRSLDSYPDASLEDLTYGADELVDAAGEIGQYPAGFLDNYRELRALVHALIQTLVDKKVVSPDEVIDATRTDPSDV
jgi:hypothetical protein